MSRTGLVVGKFCPLHLGHQRLIEFAEARCDRLLIVSYTKPEFEGCGVADRARWLEQLYPQATRLVVDDAALAAFATRTAGTPRRVPHNDAPEAEHRAFTAWLCHQMLGASVDVVFTSEAYGDGFAAALTELFAAERRGAPPVEHVCFDRDRREVPISGTAVRADPSAHRALLADVVAASLVRRVAIIGGESSGKTTLAAALAQDFGTRWVAEYGRELWEARDGRLDYDDLLQIARTQAAREEAALASAAGWLFCDTTPLVTAFYSRIMFGALDPQLETLAGRAYHHTLVCAPDFAFVQDGTRRDAAFRQAQHDWYLAALDAAGVPYTVLGGALVDRVVAARTALLPFTS